MTVQGDNPLIGAFAKVACSYNGAQEAGELTVERGDTVQVCDTAAHNKYLVRRDDLEHACYTEGWLPAYVLGLRNVEDETRSR